MCVWGGGGGGKGTYGRIRGRPPPIGSGSTDVATVAPFFPRLKCDSQNVEKQTLSRKSVAAWANSMAAAPQSQWSVVKVNAAVT